MKQALMYATRRFGRRRTGGNWRFLLPTRQIFLGTDGGATTSKVGAVWSDGTAVSTKLLQRPTRAENGPAAVVTGWVSSIDEYLRQNGLTWEQVGGVGLAIPGPVQRYGVFDHSP